MMVDKGAQEMFSCNIVDLDAAKTEHAKILHCCVMGESSG
jgi:hypothetical protein